ncbi:hypothetical protein BVRB_9g210400 [Beta vulgaris subsp. vulgaris]|nr:hypothetical protein BVRB_9g210400 [Beta vulgaris subsp. vulgaris]
MKRTTTGARYQDFYWTSWNNVNASSQKERQYYYSNLLSYYVSLVLYQ